MFAQCCWRAFSGYTKTRHASIIFEGRLMRKNRVLTITALVLLATVSSVFAKGVNQRLRLARDSSPVIVRQSVLRGESNHYRFHARARQRLSVSVSALEKNAVFHILRPRRKGAVQNTLPGAGEMNDATRWSGTLPATGEYSIVVGPTRGNASYTLKIHLQPQKAR
jgi:hypothetical protein